jgi:hypothetical protein
MSGIMANFLTTIPGIIQLLIVLWTAWQTKTIDAETLRQALVGIGFIWREVMGWLLLGGLLVALGWTVISLIRSLEQERIAAQQLRKEAEIKEKQTSVILEPRTTDDAIDRLDSGTF